MLAHCDPDCSQCSVKCGIVGGTWSGDVQNVGHEPLKSFMTKPVEFDSDRA